MYCFQFVWNTTPSPQAPDGVLTITIIASNGQKACEELDKISKPSGMYSRIMVIPVAAIEAVR